MTWAPDTAAVAAMVGLGSGLVLPRVIGALPEPHPEPVDAPGLVPAENEGAYARPVDAPKELYRALATLPGLGWRCGVACAVLAGLVGGRLGWDPALPVWVWLVPVGVALAVVDWRTRYLPTRLIAPSYVVVGALLVIPAVATSDWAQLRGAVIGWLGTFAVFWTAWFVSARLVSYGDVRLAGLLGMALGWQGLPELFVGIYAGFLLGGLAAPVLSGLRIFHHRHYPFGPFLLLGALVGLLLTSEVGEAGGWLVERLAGLLAR